MRQANVTFTDQRTYICAQVVSYSMFLSSLFQSDYINWKHGEPDGGNLSQDCVAMLPQSDNKWADVNCLNSWSYVCKKDK